FPRAEDADNRWRVLDCSANDPRSAWTWNDKINRVNGIVRVWSAATKLGDSWLICAFSPCDLPATVTLTIPGQGSFEIEAPKPWAYYVVQRIGLRATRLEPSSP